VSHCDIVPRFPSCLRVVHQDVVPVGVGNEQLRVVVVKIDFAPSCGRRASLGQIWRRRGLLVVVFSVDRREREAPQDAIRRQDLHRQRHDPLSFAPLRVSHFFLSNFARNLRAAI
jgi:hypothetical protein